MTVTVDHLEYRVDVAESVVMVSSDHRRYSVDIQLDGEIDCVEIRDHTMSIQQTSSATAACVVVQTESIRVVSVAEQGPPGPPGIAGADLDKMTHPDYPDTRREVVFNGSMITGIDVLAGDTEIFRRTITMTDGRVTVVITDDLTGNGRLIKTIGYDAVGMVTNIDRELTTWR